MSSIQLRRSPRLAAKASQKDTTVPKDTTMPKVTQVREPWPFNKFWETCVEGFRMDHPYSKDLYKFYTENYVGHEEEFVELVDSWNGIYTIKQFGETFYDYLREMYNACGAYMWDQYELFLGMGYDQYISYLKIKWCREYGIPHYEKYCSYHDFFDRHYAFTAEELRLIDNKKLPLPKPSGKFKTYEGFDEDP